jgi:hypothetical protein
VHHSVAIGIGDVIDDLTPRLQSRFASQLWGAQLTPKMIRDCIIPEDGKNRIMIRGSVYDVTQEVKASMANFLREYKMAFDQIASGGIDVGTVILTGGGHILLQPYIEELLNHNGIEFATTLNTLQLANSLGALTYALRMIKLKAFDSALDWDMSWYADQEEVV